MNEIHVLRLEALQAASLAPGVCFRQSLDLACVSLQRPTLLKRKKETFQSKSDYMLEEYYRRDVQAESVDISQYFEFSQGK